jgi:hypothetical protein
LDTSVVSGLNALKLVGVTTNTTYAVDSVIKQTVGLGSTAIDSCFVGSHNRCIKILSTYWISSQAEAEFTK